MKSRRFTKGMKEDMVSMIVGLAFNKKFDEMKKKRMRFADDCYKALYDLSQRKAMNKFQYKEQAFKHSNTMDCSFSGMSRWNMPMTEDRPFWSGSSSGGTLRFNEEHPLTIKFSKLNEEEAKLKGEKTELSREIRSIITPISTTKKLLEIWPESETWLNKVMPKEPAPVPMKSPDALNEQLCDLIGKTSPTCI